MPGGSVAIVRTRSTSPVKEIHETLPIELFGFEGNLLIWSGVVQSSTLASNGDCSSTPFEFGRKGSERSLHDRVQRGGDVGVPVAGGSADVDASLREFCGLNLSASGHRNPPTGHERALGPLRSLLRSMVSVAWPRLVRAWSNLA